MVCNQRGSQWELGEEVRRNGVSEGLGVSAVLGVRLDPQLFLVMHVTWDK